MVGVGERPGSAYNFFPAAQPLEGIFSLRPDIENLVGPEDLDQIVRFLLHDGSFEGELCQAAGRNVTMPLQKPPFPFYDSVQISGGAYIPMGVSSNTEARGGVITRKLSDTQEIHPPAQGDRRYTHEYSVVQNGQLEDRSDVSPMGSYTQTLAARKVAQTALAGRIASQKFTVPRVVGTYEFADLPDGDGGQATALLFAVPFRGGRTDQSLASPLINAVQQRPDLLDEALDTYMPPLMQTLGMIGVAAADIHDAGLVHNQLTLGNVLLCRIQAATVVDLLYVADWETAERINPADEELSRVFDLMLAFRSFSGLMERVLADHPEGAERIDPILLEGLVVLMGDYLGMSSEQLGQSLRQDKKYWLNGLYAVTDLTTDARSLDPILELKQRLSGLL